MFCNNGYFGVILSVREEFKKPTKSQNMGSFFWFDEIQIDGAENGPNRGGLKSLGALI